MKPVEKLKLLKKLSTRVSNNKLTPNDREYLSKALLAISEGEDPKIALDIQGKRGHHSSPTAARKKQRRKLAMGWIAAAITPVKEDGLGYTLERACAEASEHFHLSEQTLLKYCYRHKEERKLLFDLDLNHDFCP